jgi:hypothetical protein
MSLVNVANLLQDRGEWVEAEAMFREAVEHSATVFAPGHWMAVVMRRHLGVCLMRAGNHVEAEPVLLRTLEELRAALGPDHEETETGMRIMFELYMRWSQPEQAARYGSALRPASGSAPASAPATRRS